jgi:hypothetical protein
MHRYLVNQLPVWAFDLLIIFCVILFSAIVYFGVRRFFPKLQTETLSSAFAVLGTSYAFLLGFTISILWQNYSGAMKATTSEATFFNQIINDLPSLAPVDQIKIITGMQNYIEVMKTQEWPAMRIGEVTNVGWTALNRLYAIMYSITPSGAEDKLAYHDILATLNKIEFTRVDRLVSIDPLLNLGLRWIILLGAAFIVYSVSVNETKNKTNNLLTILIVCTLVSCNLGLVFLLNYPFSGQMGIKGERLLIDTPIRLENRLERIKDLKE